MFLENFLIGIFRLTLYRAYKKKYELPKSFRFNGYFIRIHGKGKLLVGENSYISFFSYINLCEGSKLVVGDNVSIGQNVKIYTSSFNAERLIKYQDRTNEIKNVSIGDNVLIGANVYICPGVKIGSNVVIGAGSVVTKDIPNYVVAAGSPAVAIKEYSSDGNDVK